MSTTSAGLAVELGYTNVKVMLKGVPGWKKSGRSVVASQDFAQKGNIVLVDLRSPSDYAYGHIPGAYSIPLAELEDAEYDLPENLSAPIVLYGDGAEQAYKVVKKWGFKKTAILNGGLQGWLDAGNALDATASPDEIVWVRKLGKGEVSIADFTKAVETNPADVVILDVRNTDEVAEGKFDNSINIPLEEVCTKMDMLPKDKEILVHCTTGARAEMAYQELLKAGYKVRYVVGNVECDEDGCEITE